ncbi:MAG: hypothetical protein EOO45_06780 [Flavobacterium sp.]|nr:MAG: hypothetical protein EOO45_06780 [Flavobacterium sp.]
MLNTKQSDRRNSWKYAAVVPALAAFTLLFQVQVVAQEKEISKQSNSVTAEYVSWSVEIHKDATDEEIKKESGIFKKEFDTDINVQNVTRNQKNEITGLKVTAKDKTQTKVFEVSGTEPISPFTIEVGKSGKENKNKISFGTPGKNRTVATYNMEGDSIKKSKVIISNGPNVMPPPLPPSPMAPPGHWQVNSMKIGNDDMLIVINGVKQKKGEGIKLPLNEEIEGMTILKDKEGKKKYGKEGKEGVVEITTRRTAPGKLSINNAAYGYGIDMDDLKMDLSDLTIDLAELNNMEEFKDVFKDADIAILKSAMSPENMKLIQDQIRDAQIDFDKYAASPNGLSKKEREEIKKELERTREEIKEAQKEIEQAKKEIIQAKKDLSKKA